MSAPQLSPCASLIRAHDHDRYLCALFAPAAVREAWFALFAFNHELAVISESVSEEMVGFVRFAWWREALDEIYAGGPVRRHPVAEALTQAVAAHSLPRAPFDALLNARQEKFAGEPFTELEAWQEYFRATSSGLLVLCVRVAGLEPGAALDDLGIAWGCVGTARTMDSNDPDADILKQEAQKRLAALPGLPEIFVPFADAARFYLKRLSRCKRTGSEAALPLLLTLGSRWLLRRICF